MFSEACCLARKVTCMAIKRGDEDLLGEGKLFRVSSPLPCRFPTGISVSHTSWLFFEPLWPLGEVHVRHSERIAYSPSVAWSSCGSPQAAMSKSEQPPSVQSAGDGLLIIHFDREAEIFNHAPDFWSRRAGSRQVAVDEDGVSWIESQWLERSKIMFAATGDADFRPRVEEPEEAEHFQTALRREVVDLFEWGAGDWGEHVQGNGVRFDVLQGCGQFDQVLV